MLAPCWADAARSRTDPAQMLPAGTHARLHAARMAHLRSAPIVLKCPAIYRMGVETVELAISTWPGCSIGSHVWKGAEVLVAWLSTPHLAARLAGQHVLELGAGAGYVGLAARTVSASITLTDIGDDNLALLRLNAAANAAALGDARGDTISVCELRWGRLSDVAALLPPDAVTPNIILGSDVVYEPVSARALARTVAALLLHAHAGELLSTSDATDGPSGISAEDLDPGDNARASAAQSSAAAALEALPRAVSSQASPRPYEPLTLCATLMSGVCLPTLPLSLAASATAILPPPPGRVFIMAYKARPGGAWVAFVEEAESLGLVCSCAAPACSAAAHALWYVTAAPTAAVVSAGLQIAAVVRE